MELTRGIAGEAQEQPRLVFHKYGDTFLLYPIWMHGDTGRELSARAFTRTSPLARNGGTPDILTYVAKRTR